MWAALLATMGFVASGSSNWTAINDKDSTVGKGDYRLLSTTSSFDGCTAACEALTNCTIMSWNKKSHHCYGRFDGVWELTSNPRVISGCISGVVNGCPAPPVPPSPPPPSPPPAPVGNWTWQAIPAPPAGTAFRSVCGTRPQAATVGGTVYFLPTPGTTAANLLAFSPGSGAWSTVPLPADTGVMGMLNGGTMAGVTSITGGDNYIVVSGGGTNAMSSYAIGGKTWVHGQPMSHRTVNSCSIGCLGW